MIIERVEQIPISSNNPNFALFLHFCVMSKNLYNHANYLIRQEFINNGKYIQYQDLDKLLKQDIEYPDYRNMPHAQSAQQTLRLLDSNWRSFFKSIKDWSNNKNKYLGRPRLPRYKKKVCAMVLIVTGQAITIKDNIIYFPKSFDGFTLSPVCIDRENFKSIQQIRFIPKKNKIIAEVVYRIEIPDEKKIDNGRYLSIDIGVDNLATVTNNFNEKPFIINGKGLKSINQYYNKNLAHYKEAAKRINNLYWTNRQQKLTDKRNARIKDYIHKSSRYIVNYAEAHDVTCIVIGHNKEWKQNCELGKKNNQHFIQIPFNMLIEQIQYKSREIGIGVRITEESYTSGTSFLDSEEPIKSNYDKRRRIHRGLFRTNSGNLINADVNGSLQILKKVFPNAYANGIAVAMSQPIKVNLA